MSFNRTLQHFTSSQELATPWASGQTYILDQIVINSDKLYRCTLAHTSGASFAGDSAYWSGIKPGQTISIADGGTGQTTQTAAFDALAPTTTAGDIIVYNGTDNVRQGVGSDGQVLVVDTSQTNKLKWATIAQGAKNYITYGTFENGATTGWSLAHSTLDSTTKLPNQASASWTSATSLAASAISSGQLAGSYSLQLSATASTTAGDMLVTDALTLDLEAQSTIQTFSFYYKVTANGTGTPNFSGTSSNSVAVAIYDVTNSAWIQPAGVFNLVQSSGVGRSTGTFQVPSNCASVRLAVYFPNSSGASGGSPFTVIFDDFQLGPQKVLAGAAVSDWVSYTPTGSWLTNATYTGKWRRIGDSLEVDATVTLSGAPTATSLTVALPTGITIDTNKMTAGSPVVCLGLARIQDATGSGRILGDVNYSSSTSVGILYLVAGANNFDAVNATAPFTFATGDKINLTFRVPISGWSSNTVMSQDTDTRVVAFTGSFVTPSIPTGTLDTAKIVIPNLSQDTHGAYNASTGAYTVPVSGFYRIIHENTLSLEVSRIFRVGYTINSTTNFAKIGILTNSGATFTITGNQACYGIEKLNAGDVIRFAVAHDNVSATSLTNDGRFQTYSIERLSGPATIAASEFVGASFKDSTTTLSSGGATLVFPSAGKVYDSHGAMNTSTGIYTVPVSGKYSLSCFLITTQTTGTGSITLNAFQTGSDARSVELQRLDIKIGLTSNSGRKLLQGDATFNCLAGDTLYVVGYDPDATSAIAGTRLSITRIG